MTDIANPSRPGLHAKRLKKDAPLEMAFATQWKEEHDKENLLALLLDIRQKDSMQAVQERDHVVAATLIQWLGSNVGFYFLKRVLNKCGYEIKKINHR